MSVPTHNTENTGRPAGHSHLISENVRAKLAAGEAPNRLIREKSPYLLQHAFNPVDWYPWGEEAFARARNEGKVIFLSIGYSTCYWCHVMEREVFEDPGIASLMNDLVVCIKVDREERPDVDRVYMSAVQAMTGSGGWPMSVFLTPELTPFYGATYIPPVSRHGRPGFPDLLRKIVETWKTDPERIRTSGAQLADFLKELRGTDSTGEIDRSLADRALENFTSVYDPVNAGFGGGPKFPRPAVFSFLLRYHQRTKHARALDMTLSTLRLMAAGGMYDQIGGGFHRYSVDGAWRIPHFEKMLYDQAQLAIAYTEAFQMTRDPLYQRVAVEVLEYVKGTLTGTGGGFYSAEDAESTVGGAAPGEKEEGAWYVWTSAEIRQILGTGRSEIFSYRYGVGENGNAPSDPMGVFRGKNILYLARTLEETARNFGMTVVEVDAVLAESRSLLLRSRSLRPRPHLDDKVITAWNGLMLSAFARAHQAFGIPEYRDIAQRAASFLLGKVLDRETGRLYRRYRDGEARYEGGLQDYAFLVQGLLDLYESSFDETLIGRACELTETQIRLFADDARGGFFDTPAGETSLIVRTREDYDGAEPSGNSVAALNLLRLARVTGVDRYRELGEKTIAPLSGAIGNRPDSAPALLVALEWVMTPGTEIVIAGKPGSPDTGRLLGEVYRRFLPGKVLLLADGGEGRARPPGAGLPVLSGKGMTGGLATAYVCENYACQAPTTEPAVLGKLLDGIPQAGAGGDSGINKKGDHP